MTSDDQNLLQRARAEFTQFGVTEQTLWQCSCGCGSWGTYGVGTSPHGEDALLFAGTLAGKEVRCAIMDPDELAQFLMTAEDMGIDDDATLELLGHLFRVVPGGERILA